MVRKKKQLKSFDIDIKCVVMPHAVDLPLPKYQTTGSAAMDLYAAIDDEHGGVDGGILLGRGATLKIHTGIKLEIPQGFVGLIKERSSFAARGIEVLAGIIDADYRGEIIVILHNTNNESLKIEHGDRIAQILFLPIWQGNLIKVDSLSETSRGEGGFGSTGIK